MKLTRSLLPTSLATLLAACATTPPTTGNNSHAAPAPAPAVSAPAPAASIAATPQPMAATSAHGDVWEKLRSSFVMDDCDADPQITLWAHRYTQNAQHFQAQMSTALSQLAYVEQVAEKYDVAGEFVLLPWVESQFKAVPGKRNAPAGMWQIEPTTAHSMGLHVDHNYDGRLDTSAATDRVMHTLHQYHDDLHDWRLVDYAFNRGEMSIQRILKSHGVPPKDPVIPKWPVPSVTKEHLAKLLALACVVRDPARFHVTLPTLAAEDHLEGIIIAPGMTLSALANHAGMPMDDLRRLNPAMLKDALDANLSSQILMPHRNAEQWRSTMQVANAQDMTASNGPVGSVPSSPDADVAQASVTKPRTHTVRPGESLWQIAHKYSVSVTNIEHLNGLHGKPLKPGQVLKLDAP